MWNVVFISFVFLLFLLRFYLFIFRKTNNYYILIALRFIFILVLPSLAFCFDWSFWMNLLLDDNNTKNCICGQLRWKSRNSFWFLFVWSSWRMRVVICMRFMNFCWWIRQSTWGHDEQGIQMALEATSHVTLLKSSSFTMIYSFLIQFFFLSNWTTRISNTHAQAAISMCWAYWPSIEAKNSKTKLANEPNEFITHAIRSSTAIFTRFAACVYVYIKHSNII